MSEPTQTPWTDSREEHAGNVMLYIETAQHGYTRSDAMVVSAKDARDLERVAKRLADALKRAKKGFKSIAESGAPYADVYARPINAALAEFAKMMPKGDR